MCNDSDAVLTNLLKVCNPIKMKLTEWSGLELLSKVK